MLPTKSPKKSFGVEMALIQVVIDMVYGRYTMLGYQIGLSIAEIIVICGVIFASQLYIAKILLQNVNNRINQLDQTLAEAIQSVVEANFGDFQPQNPLIGIITDIMKQNITKNADINPDLKEINTVPRGKDGKFTISQDT